MSEVEEKFQTLVCAIEDASDEEMPEAESKLVDFVLCNQDIIAQALRQLPS